MGQQEFMILGEPEAKAPEPSGLLARLRARVSRPEVPSRWGQVLCIDELSLGLAPTTVATLTDHVRRIHQAGLMILHVGHEEVPAARIPRQAIGFRARGDRAHRRT